VGVAQLAEHMPVEHEVAGSFPVAHPKNGEDIMRLQTYNAFGGLIVKRTKVTVSMTAIQDTTSIHRTIAKETELRDIAPTETVRRQIIWDR
jgi:hypothetical protein